VSNSPNVPNQLCDLLNFLRRHRNYFFRSPSEIAEKGDEPHSNAEGLLRDPLLNHTKSRDGPSLRSLRFGLPLVTTLWSRDGYSSEIATRSECGFLYTECVNLNTCIVPENPRARRWSQARQED
jgi:hypothetical protein